MKKEYKDVVMPSKKAICLCCCCGERFAGDANGNCALFCKTCRKKEGRKAIIEENQVIAKERGYEYKGFTE